MKGIHMKFNKYEINSDDIKEFELSTDIDTIKWLKFFKEFNPYDTSKEQRKELSLQMETVRQLVPNTEPKPKHFRNWKEQSLIYASIANYGAVPSSKSQYAHGVLIARMVLAYYLIKKIKVVKNGYSIKQQVQALGFNLEKK